MSKPIFHKNFTAMTDVPGVNLDVRVPVTYSLSEAEGAAADADGILDGTALGAEASTVTTFLAQPPCPRNVTIVASDAQTGKATITGTNIAGATISEELTINGATPVVGSKAFKTITSIALPVKAGTETVDVGWGSKIGLPVKLSRNTVLAAYLDKAREATAPTVAVSATALESNTVTLNSSLNGKVVDIEMLI